MAMNVIGIDPGLSGALAMIGAKGLLAYADMPLMVKSGGTVKNQVNAAALNSLLQDWTQGCDKIEIHIVIEVVRSMPKQGVATMFSLGHTCGIIEGVVAARGLSHEMITPQQWKKHYGLKAEKNDAKGIVKDKARTLAQRYYPEAPLGRKMDHNRAEAILIARYGHEQRA